MIAAIALIVLMILAQLSVARSPIGQRYSGEFPKWVLRVGSRRPPGFFRTTVGLQLTWLARRAWPLVSVIAFVKVLELFNGTTDSLGIHLPLSTTTWVTLSAVLAALFTAGYAFQPAKRNGPLSLWSAWVTAAIPVTTGLAFLGLAIGYSQNWLDVVSWAPITSALASWTSEHSVEDAVGIASTLVGVGVAMMALQEGAPPIGDPSTTPFGLRLGSTKPVDAPATSSRPKPPPKRTSRRKNKGKRRHR